MRVPRINESEMAEGEIGGEERETLFSIFKYLSL